MEWYPIVKSVHILSGAVLFGTGLGIAFFFFVANRRPDLPARLFAARTTVLADFIFTLPAAVLQPLTGIWLINHLALDRSAAWLVATYCLYAVAGLCWLPVVWIQIRLQRMLADAVSTGRSLPPDYDRLFRIWFLLGWPAFIALLTVYYLMAARPF